MGLIAEAQPRWAVSWQMQEAGHAPSHEVSKAQADAELAHEEHGFHTMATIIATCAMLAGVFMAWLVYSRGVISPAKAAQVLAPVHKLLWNKFYFDELYRATFVAGVLLLASFGKWFDRVILDGLADGSARWVARLAFFSGLTLDNRGVDGLVNGVAKAGPGRREPGAQGPDGSRPQLYPGPDNRWGRGRRRFPLDLVTFRYSENWLRWTIHGC